MRRHKSIPLMFGIDQLDSTRRGRRSAITRSAARASAVQTAAPVAASTPASSFISSASFPTTMIVSGAPL